MIEDIDRIFPFLFAVSTVFFIVVFVLVIAYKLKVLENSNWWKYLKNNAFFRIFLALGVVSVILFFSLKSYVKKLSRIEIKETVELLAKRDYTLIINNEVAVNDSLIVALQNISSESNARNIGAPEINLRITDGNIYKEFRLLRDHSFKAKYRVFYNNYENTSEYCIGEINTSSLDKYQ